MNADTSCVPRYDCCSVRKVVSDFVFSSCTEDFISSDETVAVAFRESRSLEAVFASDDFSTPGTNKAAVKAINKLLSSSKVFTDGDFLTPDKFVLPLKAKLRYYAGKPDTRLRVRFCPGHFGGSGHGCAVEVTVLRADGPLDAVNRDYARTFSVTEVLDGKLNFREQLRFAFYINHYVKEAAALEDRVRALFRALSDNVTITYNADVISQLTQTPVYIPSTAVVRRRSKAWIDAAYARLSWAATPSKFISVDAQVMPVGLNDDHRELWIKAPLHLKKTIRLFWAALVQDPATGAYRPPSGAIERLFQQANDLLALWGPTSTQVSLMAALCEDGAFQGVGVDERIELVNATLGESVPA